MGTDEELAEEKIKEMFPKGYCIGGNYEGYKRAILEGIKIGRRKSLRCSTKGVGEMLIKEFEEDSHKN